MVDHVQPGGTDLTDPLVYQGQRLVPMLQRQVSAKEQRGIFFWAKPDPAIAEKPRLEVDFLIDGKLAVKGRARHRRRRRRRILSKSAAHATSPPAAASPRAVSSSSMWLRWVAGQ